MNELANSPISGDNPGAIADINGALVPTMPIADIKVGTRHRRDMGDVTGLARSISEVGLLHPIVVKPDGTLIAGERRLAAFKQLDRTEIPITVVDIDEVVRGELAENAERKDFLPSEIEAIRRALEPIEKQAAKERQAMAGGRAPGKLPEAVSPSRVRDKIGALAGVSGRTVEKIAAVVAAAEAEPKKFSHLVDEMDKTGRVDRAHQQLKIERQREAHAVRGGRPSTPAKPNGVPGWAEAWSKAPPKQRQNFIEKVGLMAIVAAATDDQKATLPFAVCDVLKVDGASAIVPPAGIKSPDEILALVRRLRIQERRREFLDVFDWVESAALQMVRKQTASPIAAPEPRQLAEPHHQSATTESVAAE